MNRSVEDILKEMKERITPPRELFSRTLEMIDERSTVTEDDKRRYTILEKGRKEQLSLIDQIQDLMTSKLKFIFPLGGLAVAVLLLIVLTGSKKEGVSRSERPALEKEERLVPPALPTEVGKIVVPATSNISELVNVLLTVAASDEQSVLQDASADAGFVNLETTSISDFGQSVNGSF